MRLGKGKKLSRKLVTLSLAIVMAEGGSLSVFAATGFTVSDPSLTYLNGGYIVSGGMSYSSSSGSTSYYLRDVVTGLAKVNGSSTVYEKAGYEYGKASAMTDNMPARPYFIQNEGSYNSGTGFVIVDTKIKTNP